MSVFAANQVGDEGVAPTVSCYDDICFCYDDIRSSSSDMI